MKAPQKKIVTINGKEAIIFYRSSKSKQKDITKFNKDTIKVIDELLKGSNSSFRYPNGITTLNTFYDWIEKQLSVTRIANHITELRKVIPNGWLITFKYVGERKKRYGLIKDKRAIKFLQSLKQKIMSELDI